MKCPFCGSADTQVIDSRVSEAGDSIRRRRRCTACQKRFTTYETVELRLPQVVKTNGDRAEFDTARLRVGFATGRCATGDGNASRHGVLQTTLHSRLTRSPSSHHPITDKPPPVHCGCWRAPRLYRG